MSKVYKGQGVIVEGSLVGETIIVTKLSYDTALNLEYLGEAKYGSGETENRWFIQRFFYDSTLSLTDIKNATNRTTTDTTLISSIDVTDPRKPCITIGNGDFSQVMNGDMISLTTPLQSISGVPIIKISDTEICLDFSSDCALLPTVPILAETNVPIQPSNLIITLVNDRSKDMTKRAWACRERYFYE